MSVISGLRGGPMLRPRRAALAGEPWISELTGDVTAVGPGVAAATLATVLATPGSFTVATLTVDAKGRITAASGGVVDGGMY